MNESEGVELANTSTPLFVRTSVFIFTHILFPVLSSLAMAYLAWLSWGVAGDEHAQSATLVIASIAIPVWSVVVACLWRDRIPMWVSVLGAIFGIAYLYSFCLMINTVLANVDNWIVSATPYMLTFGGMMPMIFSGICRVATRSRSVQWFVDVMQSFMLLILSPAILFSFLIFVVDEDLFNKSITGVLKNIIVHGTFIFSILATSAFFVGLLRVLHLLLARHVSAMNETIKRRMQIFFFALLLPILGLCLNRAIPFPADFSGTSVYILVAYLTLVLLPRPRATIFGLLIYFAQMIAAPFVLYFFLIFLPFLPLAVMALLVMGCGFLMLAPTLLFRFYCFEMATAFRVLHTRFSRGTLIMVALLAFSILPMAIVVNTERERADVRALLAWHTQENFNAAIPPPISCSRASTILKHIRAFNNGNEIPLISAWTTYRVYDGLYLANDLLTAMEYRFTGRVNISNSDLSSRNMYGVLFASSTARQERNRGRQVFQAPLSTIDTFTVTSVTATQSLVTVRFAIPGVEEGGAKEFNAPLTLPAGTWLAGMRLKMPDGTWKTGRITERKTAEWVYRKITFLKRDPCIVTLDTPTNGRIRVFPVDKLGREVELTVCLPTHDSVSNLLTIARTPIANPAYRATPRIITAEEAPVSVVTAAWKDAHRAEAMPRMPGDTYWVRDASSTSGDSAWATNRLTSTHQTWLVQANATTHIVRVADAEPPTLIPATYGLDAASTLRHILRHATAQQRTAEDAVRVPEIRFVGENWLPALQRITPKQWITIRAEYPGLTSVSVGDAVIPVATNVTSRVFVLPTARGTFCAVPDDGESSLVFDKLPNAEVVDGVWARGAVAWAMQYNAQQNPVVDLRRAILRESRACGVMTTMAALIVLETDAQEKAMKLKEKEALRGHSALDFDESHEKASASFAPGFVSLVLGLIFLFIVLRIRRALNV